MNMYTTIIHPLRKAFNLSMNEYCVLDTIYHLSKNNKYWGWCIQSQSRIWEILDLSRRTIVKIINTLIEKWLIEKWQTWFRTVDEWNDLISNKDKISIQSGQLLTINKFTGCEESSQVGVKKVHRGCEESSHNNNIDNYIDNNIYNNKKLAEKEKTNLTKSNITN